MPPSSIEKLVQIFEKLPGIGRRQASRFAYWLVDAGIETKNDFIEALNGLKNIKRCETCFKTHEKVEKTCFLCRDEKRDTNKLIVVEKDVDLEAIEKAGVYNGCYYILGGFLSRLNPNNQSRLRIRELFERVKRSPNITEVILATTLTAEGEITNIYIEKILEPLQKVRRFKITRLGRGLSTGAELEYLNRETLKNALDNRK